MTNPIDIIAKAVIDDALSNGNDCDLHITQHSAQIAVHALTDGRIVDNAVLAVRQHFWTADDVEELSDRALRAIILIAFSSVAGGA